MTIGQIGCVLIIIFSTGLTINYGETEAPVIVTLFWFVSSVLALKNLGSLLLTAFFFIFMVSVYLSLRFQQIYDDIRSFDRFGNINWNLNLKIIYLGIQNTFLLRRRDWPDRWQSTLRPHIITCWTSSKTTTSAVSTQCLRSTPGWVNSSLSTTSCQSHCWTWDSYFWFSRRSHGPDLLASTCSLWSVSICLYSIICWPESKSKPIRAIIFSILWWQPRISAFGSDSSVWRSSNVSLVLKSGSIVWICLHSQTMNFMSS